MITKEELKKEVDKLPENVLEEVYALLKKVVYENANKHPFTLRDFKGRLDNTDIRKASYE